MAANHETSTRCLHIFIIELEAIVFITAYCTGIRIKELLARYPMVVSKSDMGEGKSNQSG